MKPKPEAAPSTAISLHYPYGQFRPAPVTRAPPPSNNPPPSTPRHPPLHPARTIRDFSPDPVPAHLIEQAIQIASRAPSGANQQPWRFVVVQDPILKQQIRAAAETEERENYDHRFPAEWLEALQPFGTDWHKPSSKPPPT